MNNSIRVGASIYLFTTVYFISIYVVGIFHNYLSCLFSIAMILWLCFYVRKKGTLKININIATVAIFVICVAYLLTSIWAIDSGMAVIGFFKYFPVILFLIAIIQEQQIIEQIHKGLPYVVAFMAVVSFFCMQIPAVEEYFSVAGRLAGFLQYPNTFGILLLISELLLFGKDRLKVSDFILLSILLLGVILTGSRTVFILMIISNVVMIIAVKKRKSLKAITLIAVIIVLLMIIVTLFGDGYLTERLLRISASESTFIGRLLYFQDALPLIIAHPFGTGYMGYYYLQQSIQTGLYSVRFIHNDFLQLLLDIGWIPCILFISAIIKAVLSRNIKLYKKIILITVCLHSCFDFNMQYISIFCLIITFLDIYNAKRVIELKNNIVVKGILLLSLVVNVYMGVVLLGENINKYELSHKLYPWNTQNEIKRIITTTDAVVQETIADDILQRNEYVVLAYSVKARNAYQQGEFSELMINKQKILDIAPFEYDEYVDYCYKLIEGISLFTQVGDSQSAAICMEELIFVEERLSEIDQKLSDLGRQINDQPETELPDDIQEYIKTLKGGQNENP